MSQPSGPILGDTFQTVFVLTLLSLPLCQQINRRSIPQSFRGQSQSSEVIPRCLFVRRTATRLQALHGFTTLTQPNLLLTAILRSMMRAPMNAELKILFPQRIWLK